MAWMRKSLIKNFNENKFEYIVFVKVSTKEVLTLFGIRYRRGSNLKLVTAFCFLV